jgi:hypothetical protein
MANKYFSQLTQIAAGSIASGDAMAIEDISAGETKYATAADVATYVSSTLAGASGGWDAVSDTWTYLGTTTGAGTVSIPAGGTLLYGKGDKIKFVQGGTQLYFYVTAVGGTTLAITAGSDYTLGTAAISSVYYSKIENPLNFPDWFNYAITHTGFSANPTYLATFKVYGRMCIVTYACTGAGTSSQTYYTITLPLAAATRAGMGWWSALAWLQNNSTVEACGQVEITSAGTTAGFHRSAQAAWTNSGGKQAKGIIIYEI